MLTAKDELRQIADYLREAAEAVRRQQGGPFDRGDGKVIMEALGEFLRLVSVEEYHRLATDPTTPAF